MGDLLNKLLIVLNDRDLDSTDYHIAMTLLTYYNNLYELPIGDVAKLCDVSKSTISKFIRSLGFGDYLDFKMAAPFKENKYGFKLNYNQNIAEYIEKEGYEDYLQKVQRDITELQNSLTKENIRKLAADLRKYKKIAAFGLLFSEIGAIDLQMKLAYNGKFIITNLNDRKQETYIQRSDEDTLIIIYSNSGSYIQRYQLSEFQEKKDYSKIKGKIVLITGNSRMQHHPVVDLCISFQHKSQLCTHSEIFPLINDWVIMEYRKLKKIADLLQ